MNIIIPEPTKGIELNATTALIAAELRFQKEVDKAALVQKKFQQEAQETIMALGQQNAKLKTALIASEGSKKEIETLSTAKEKAVQEENEKLKEENKKLREVNTQLHKQLTDLMQQVVRLDKKNSVLMRIYNHINGFRGNSPEHYADCIQQGDVELRGKYCVIA